MLRINLLTAAVIAVLSVGTLQAQEVDEVKNVATEAVEAVEAVANASEAVSETEKVSATAVSLDQEGNLVGIAFVNGEEKTPIGEAKVTIANADGVVVDSVTADEDGSFAFTSIAPGTYNMYGTAANYVGAQTYDVLPYSSGGCSSCDLGMTTYAPQSYDTFASAPCSSCAPARVSSCGGGCGGGGLFGGGGFGGGGGLLGGGGGGLLGGSRFLRFAAIGGVVAIATSDSSPDN